MKQLIICLFFLLRFGESKAQHWIGANLPLYPLDIVCVYSDTTNDLLYVAGNIFNSQGATDQVSICKYDGINWTTIGTFNGKVWSIVYFNGELFIGGAYTEVNGMPMPHMTRYDGFNWYVVGDFNATVFNLKIIDSELYAMGLFSLIDSVNMNGIAKYHSFFWGNVDSFPVVNASINNIEKYNNEIYVGGNFYDSTLGLEDMAYYHNGSWQKVGQGFFGGFTGVSKLLVYKNELYAGGLIEKGLGNAGNGIQKWNGTTWSEPSESLQGINNTYGTNMQLYDMHIYNDELYVTGGFYFADHVPAFCLAKWDGARWCGFGTTYDLESPVAAFNFFHDTLFTFYWNDSLNNNFVNRFIKWTGGNFVDTCSSPNGISENETEEEFYFYPNPTTLTFTINIPLISISYRLIISDVLNRQIKTEILPAKTTRKELDISELTTGIYFLTLESEKGRVTKKLIKE